MIVRSLRMDRLCDQTGLTEYLYCSYHYVEGVDARRPYLKRREKDIVNLTNNGTVSKAPLGKLPRDGIERIIMGFPERINFMLT